MYIIKPARNTPAPIIATIPHSGRQLPDNMKEAMVPRHANWLKNTDWYLDQLYDFLPDLGVMTIAASFSRYVCDVNRDPLASAPGLFFNSAVPIFTDTNEHIYFKPPTEQDAIDRIEKYHAPFHRAIDMQLQATIGAFRKIWLLDLHSFMGPGCHDVCIGNVSGSSSSEELLQFVASTFRNQGFDTRCNDPFSGGYIVKKYANLTTVQALLIELRYPTYLNCDTIDEALPPTIDEDRINDVLKRLKNVFTQMVAASRDA